MLQAATTDLFNTVVRKAHNSEWQNLLFQYKFSQQKSVKVIVCGLLFFVPSALMG